MREPTITDPTGEKLRQWMDDRVRRVKDDWDELIVCTGPERSGKSAIAFEMALYMDPDFDPEKQTVFTGESFRRRAIEMQKYKPLVLDEAIKGGFSRRAGSGANVGLAEYLTVGGERNLINFVCWPGARWLDPILREWRSTWNVNVLTRKRDHAVAQIRQFHEGEKVYDPPRVLFTFAYPKPRGRRWDQYRAAKSKFVERVGRTGGDDGHDDKEAFYEQCLRVMKPRVEVLRRGL